MWRRWLQLALSLPLWALLLGADSAKAKFFNPVAAGAADCLAAGPCIRVADEDELLTKLRAARPKESPPTSATDSETSKRQDERVRIKERAIKRFEYEDQRLKLDQIERRLGEPSK